MGKATVYQHLGDGKYSVLYTPEITQSKARIDALEQLKKDLDAQLYSTNGLVEARAAAEKVYNDASNAFFYALDDWAWCARQLPPCPEQGALMTAIQARGGARSEAGFALNTIISAIADNRAKYYSTTQEIAFLQNTQKGSGAGLMDVWCIDLDPEQIIPTNTIVGTIETFGAKGGYAGGSLPRKYVNIQTCTDPEYVSTRDHCVKPLSGFKTAALFFNWCQWLYVMSRNPQHVVGIVLSKFDAGQTYLDVAVYGSTPGANPPVGYPFDRVNYAKTLLNLPVEYLSCGAEIFEEGDAVIVSFTDVNMAGAKVIGFAENPKECANRILVRGTFQDGLKTKYMLTTSCASTFTTHANPDYTSIGWMDWIDSTGKAALWIALPGSLGHRRYGKFVTSSVSARQIFRRAGSPITVAADVWGMTQFEGQVFYATKTSTDFEVRKTDETVIASISIASIVAALPEYPGVTTTINHMIDGWFKFSADGASGATMLSTQQYLEIQLTSVDDVVSAAFEIKAAPTGSLFTTPEIVFTESVEGFCDFHYLNVYSGKSEAWGIDYIGNDINFLFIDIYSESLSLPVTTVACTNNHTCFWRREARTYTRWRIAEPGSHAFDHSNSTGVLASFYTLDAFTHFKDWVPSLDGSGEMFMTDLDIRRRAGAFVGNQWTVLSASSARAELNAVFVFDGETQVVHDIDGLSHTDTLYDAAVSQDGGFSFGGNQLPDECAGPSSISEIPDDATGELGFTSYERADMFTFSNSNALFFVEAEGNYYHYRYCDGDYFDITATVGQMPVMYGYKCG